MRVVKLQSLCHSMVRLCNFNMIFFIKDLKII